MDDDSEIKIQLQRSSFFGYLSLTFLSKMKVIKIKQLFKIGNYAKMLITLLHPYTSIMEDHNRATAT